MIKSLLITGTPDGLRGVKPVNERLESVPYEKFPFCCSSKRDSSVEREFNMSKKDIAPIKKSYFDQQRKLKSYQTKQEVNKSSSKIKVKKIYPVDPNDFWSP